MQQRLDCLNAAFKHAGIETLDADTSEHIHTWILRYHRAPRPWMKQPAPTGAEVSLPQQEN